MSEQIVIGKKLAPFSWLPNYLVNDPNVSIEALSVALYLNGKPSGWRPRPFDICKRFGFGDHTWRKVSKELKALGLLHEKITKDGTELWFELPEMQLSFIEKPTVENQRPVADRRKADRGKSTPLYNKDHNKKDVIFHNNHKDHKSDEGYEILKDKKAPKDKSKLPKQPSLAVRKKTMSSDEQYVFDKMVALPGLYEAVAMTIVEQHPVGTINYFLEKLDRRLTVKGDIPNPGSWIRKCLHNKVDPMMFEDFENEDEELN